MIGKLIVGKGGEPKVLAQAPAPAAERRPIKGIGMVIATVPRMAG